MGTFIVERGLVTAFLSIVGAALGIYCLVPGCYWSSTSSNFLQPEDGSRYISLWKECRIYNFNGTNTTTCQQFGLPKENDFKNITAPFADRQVARDTAAAGCVLSSAAALLAFCFAVCHNKCCTAFTSLLASLFSMATVASWVDYQITANNDDSSGTSAYSYSFGFVFATVAAVANLAGFIASWYIRKTGEYEYMA